MNVGKPYIAISATIDTELLVALVGSREARSGRQLAEEIGRSPTGVQHALDRLVSEGLVHRVSAGRAFLYTLNFDHLLAQAVQEMAGARAELVRRLRQRVMRWKTEPRHLSLFGSAARGDGDAESDVDLFLVRPVGVDSEDESWRKQVEQLAEKIHIWTGNNAGIVELGEKQLSGLRRRRPPALRELDRDAIDIAGTPVRKLLKK
ncbi:MAG: nucleotidyltransferase domain-containing protein [Solirubrobacterales bacterium]